MTALINHTLNSCEVATLYALVACGFYLASIGTRHFAFAAAASFLIAPYCVVSMGAFLPKAVAYASGLTLCAILGLLYTKITVSLARKGSREGQMLIISLAAMAIAENLVSMMYGSSSRTLSEGGGTTWLELLDLKHVNDQLVVLATGLALIFSVLIVWRNTLIGKVIRALIESRLNLSLRGISAQSVEQVLTVAGFVIIGVSGLLWSIDGRVKPSVCTEMGIVGAVTLIAGTMIGAGILGPILASLVLAVGKVAFALRLEGDWSKISMICLLIIALVARRRETLLDEDTR